MNDKPHNSSTSVFLSFLVVIIIGGLLFIHNQTQFHETIAEESSSNNHELEDLKLELSEKRKELSKVKDELLTTQIKLTTKTKQLHTQLEEKNTEIQTLQGKLDQKNTELGDKNTEIQTLQGKVEQQNTQLGDKNRELQTLQGKVEQQNTQLGDKNRELQTLQGKVEQQNTQLGDKNRELQTLQGKVEQQNTQLGDKNRELQTLQGKVEQQNTQLGDKNRELQTLQGKVEQQNTQLGDKNRELQTLQGKVEQQNTQLGDKNRELQTLQGKVEQQNTQLGDKNRELQTLQGKVEQQNTQLGDKNRELQTLQGKVEQQNTQLGDKNRELQTLQGKVEQQNTQLGDKNRELQTLQGKVEQQNTQLGDKNRELQTLQGKVEQQNTQLGDKNRELQTLQGKVEQQNTQLGDKNRELQTLQGKVEQQNTQLGDKNRELQTLQGKVEQQNTQLGDKNREIQTLQGKVEQQNTPLGDKNRELLTIKKTLSNSNIRSMIAKIDISQRNQNLLNIKSRLKHFYIDDYNLTDIDKEILSNYNYNSVNDEAHWRLSENNLQSKCIKLSEFGIKLLRNVNNIPKNSREYSRVINDIVKRVNHLIDNNIKTLGENEDVIAASATLLSMHRLIYPDDDSFMISHSTICKLIPEIPSIKSIYPNSNGRFDKNKYKKLLNLSTPRLLTNYINNTTDYMHDVNSGALYVFNSTINNDYCDHVMLDGIRQDGSAFTVHPTRNVLHIDYSYYLKDVVAQIKYPDFYASVYSELKIPGNYYDVVKKIVSILMHPNIDFVLHGLISSEGKIKFNFNWLDIKGETGCHLIPSIGFGNFKTDKLMFSLRIQMPGIPTSCLEICDTEQRLKCNPFATSIMNMRKIYVVDDSRLKDYENWNAASEEAGIIVSLENSTYMLLDESTYVYSDCDNDYSNSNYIGQLTLENQVMFWKRDCHIKSAGDINYKITEVGVITFVGLESIYQIHNLSSSPLRFEWTGWSSTIKHWADNLGDLSWKKDFIIIPTGKPVSFKWYMRPNKKHFVRLMYKDKKQTFNYNGHKYIVENMPNDPQSFTVKCDTDDNVILIGNNSIRVNDSVTYNNVTYYRDNRTMMYVRP
ncbi:putative envelope protein ODV-E66-3 [Microplitis demolitor]|nr:putative envelope protein ODV-E66-3 [Microplitis demolitor]KAG6558475.1 putative envelope protein ODV-E66-3 [Microplitis demolitor]